MAKWYDQNGNLMEDDTLEIGVTKAPRIMEGPPPGMEIAGARRPPMVEGLTIDRTMMGPDRVNPMGQFRPYAEFSTRPASGGERRVVTDEGARRLMAADRRLREGGYGGVMVRDGIITGTDAEGNRVQNVMTPEGFAPIRSNDQRIAMSPEALGIMGNRQLQEEAALQRGPFSTQAMENRMSVRKELQAQADSGSAYGFAPNIDARNREIMRGTEARQAGRMLDRSRPRDLMQRRNTADQIMTQADASLMTPQIQVQDGVMAGWDPINRKIVSDSSGAKALAASRSKYTPMTYDEMDINDLTKSINDTIGSAQLSTEERKMLALELGGIRKPEEIEKIRTKYKGAMSDQAMTALTMQMEALQKRKTGAPAGKTVLLPGWKYEAMKRK